MNSPQQEREIALRRLEAGGAASLGGRVLTCGFWHAKRHTALMTVARRVFSTLAARPTVRERGRFISGRVWNVCGRVCKTNERACVSCARVCMTCARVCNTCAHVCNTCVRVRMTCACVCNAAARVWNTTKRVWIADLRGRYTNAFHRATPAYPCHNRSIFSDDCEHRHMRFWGKASSKGKKGTN